MKLNKILYLFAFLFIASISFSQTAGRIYIEREIDFSKSGFVYNISGDDTLRADTLSITLWDNYILTGIALSGTPALNVYCFAGMLPITLKIDSANPNMLSQYNLYDSSSYTKLLNLSGWFNCQDDSSNYRNIYTYYNFDSLQNYNYFFLSLVNVHTFFPTVNKIHIILYLRRFI